MAILDLQGLDVEDKESAGNRRGSRRSRRCGGGGGGASRLSLALC
ncbi:MAG: SapB/AmfS family lanthipeptide [Mycobacteriales bacterium]